MFSRYRSSHVCRLLLVEWTLSGRTIYLYLVTVQICKWCEFPENLHQISFWCNLNVDLEQQQNVPGEGWATQYIKFHCKWVLLWFATTKMSTNKLCQWIFVGNQISVSISKMSRKMGLSTKSKSRTDMKQPLLKTFLLKNERYSRFIISCTISINPISLQQRQGFPGDNTTSR